ncbi:hypothetical protein F442_18420 [Phytophthora nicotianae P10297]|uniref:Uncharacterized protein n=2 Tax=Phytophthora nicotianae TaxID=4792 RepID=W2YDB9_PHYNI|nr:hypothetical protein F442_18420 [Phytophthora nicotianae P10297]
MTDTLHDSEARQLLGMFLKDLNKHATLQLTPVECKSAHQGVQTPSASEQVNPAQTTTDSKHCTTKSQKKKKSQSWLRRKEELAQLRQQHDFGSRGKFQDTQRMIFSVVQQTRLEKAQHEN